MTGMNAVTALVAGPNCTLFIVHLLSASNVISLALASDVSSLADALQALPLDSKFA